MSDINGRLLSALKKVLHSVTPDGLSGFVMQEAKDAIRDAEAAARQPLPPAIEMAQHAAICLNAEERGRFAAWFREWRVGVMGDAESLTIGPLPLDTATIGPVSAGARTPARRVPGDDRPPNPPRPAGDSDRG